MNLAQQFEEFNNEVRPKRGITQNFLRQKDKVEALKKAIESLMVEALFSTEDYADLVILGLTNLSIELENDERDLVVCRAKWQKLKEEQSKNNKAKGG